MGHGFDDQGSEFDESGKIRNWWTADDQGRFKAADRQAGAQFDSYCPLPNTCVKGPAHHGREYLAILAGWRWPTPPIMSHSGGRTPGDRRLHGRSALLHVPRQSWLDLYRDDMLRQLVLTNPHAPDITGPTAPSGTSTPGMRPSASRRAMPSTCHPTSACISGKQPRRGRGGPSGLRAKAAAPWNCRAFRRLPADGPRCAVDIVFR